MDSHTLHQPSETRSSTLVQPPHQTRVSGSILRPFLASIFEGIVENDIQPFDCVESAVCHGAMLVVWMTTGTDPPSNHPCQSNFGCAGNPDHRSFFWRSLSSSLGRIPVLDRTVGLDYRLSGLEVSWSGKRSSLTLERLRR